MKSSFLRLGVAIISHAMKNPAFQAAAAHLFREGVRMVHRAVVHHINTHTHGPRR